MWEKIGKISIYSTMFYVCFNFFVSNLRTKCWYVLLCCKHLFAYLCFTVYTRIKKWMLKKKIIYILYKDRHAGEKSVNRNKYPKNWWYRIPLSHGKIFERDKIMIQFFSFQFRFDVFHLFRAIDDYICFNSG